MALRVRCLEHLVSGKSIPGVRDGSEGASALETQKNRQLAKELFRQGVDAYKEGRLADAIRLWQKVSNLDPRHPRAAKYRAKALARLPAEERDMLETEAALGMVEFGDGALEPESAKPAEPDFEIAVPVDDGTAAPYRGATAESAWQSELAGHTVPSPAEKAEDSLPAWEEARSGALPDWKPAGNAFQSSMAAPTEGGEQGTFPALPETLSDPFGGGLPSGVVEQSDFETSAPVPPALGQQEPFSGGEPWSSPDSGLPRARAATTEDPASEPFSELPSEPRSQEEASPSGWNDPFAISEGSLSSFSADALWSEGGSEDPFSASDPFQESSGAPLALPAQASDGADSEAAPLDLSTALQDFQSPSLPQDVPPDGFGDSAGLAFGNAVVQEEPTGPSLFDADVLSLDVGDLSVSDEKDDEGVSFVAAEFLDQVRDAPSSEPAVEGIGGTATEDAPLSDQAGAADDFPDFSEVSGFSSASDDSVSSQGSESIPKDIIINPFAANKGRSPLLQGAPRPKPPVSKLPFVVALAVFVVGGAGFYFWNEAGKEQAAIVAQQERDLRKQQEQVKQARQKVKAASEALKSGQTVQARDLLEEAVALDPENKGAVKQLAVAQGQLDERVKSFVEEGGNLLRRSQYEACLIYVSRGLEIDPKHKELKALQKQAGELQKIKGSDTEIAFRYRNSREFVKEAGKKEAEGKLVEALELLLSASKLHKTEEMERRIGVIRGKLADDGRIKRNAASIVEEGKAFLRSGNPTSARLSFRRVLSVLPKYQPALEGLKEANAALKRQEDLRYYKWMTIRSYKYGNTGEALRFVRKWLELDPEDQGAQFYLNQLTGAEN